MKFEFEPRARELCREAGIPESGINVAALVKAMEHGAGEAMRVTAVRLNQATTELKRRRERANAPQ